MMEPSVIMAFDEFEVETIIVALEVFQEAVEDHPEALAHGERPLIYIDLLKKRFEHGGEAP
jgi:hypothetical protein